MKPILVLVACLVASQAAPTPGYLGYNVNQVNLENTFLTKPNGFDYTINYPEYPIYPSLIRQDAPTFHSLKPQYPPHLYPYQAIFFVSTVGASQPPPAGASFAFRPRPDYPDVDLGQYEQANLYTVDYVQDPNAPALHPGGPILAPLPVVPAFDRAPVVQEEVPARFEPVDQPEERENEDVPALDLNPYKLPMLPEEEMHKEVPAIVTTSDDEPMPAPSTNLDDDVKKIPIYVSSEEGSVEVNSAAKDNKEEMAAPITDLFDDVKKIVESDVVSDSENVGVTDAPEAAAGSASEGEVDLLEATTEAPVSSSSIEAVKQEEGSTESTMTSTETSS